MIAANRNKFVGLLLVCGLLSSCGDDDDDSVNSMVCNDLFTEIIGTALAYSFDESQCGPYEIALQNYIDEGCTVTEINRDGDEVSFTPADAQADLDALDCSG